MATTKQDLIDAAAALHDGHEKQQTLLASFFDEIDRLQAQVKVGGEAPAAGEGTGTVGGDGIEGDSQILDLIKTLRGDLEDVTAANTRISSELKTGLEAAPTNEAGAPVLSGDVSGAASGTVDAGSAAGTPDNGGTAAAVPPETVVKKADGSIEFAGEPSTGVINAGHTDPATKTQDFQS